MVRVLVLYGTTDGHTGEVARALGEAMRAHAAEVDVVDAAGPGVVVDPGFYDGIIVGASVRAGRYQKSVARWVRHHAAALNGMPTAFVSVCLAVLENEPKVQHEVTATIDRFLTATGWRPSMTKPVAGALRYTRYNIFMRWMMKRIVAKGGGDTDTSRDYEYTDWNDLRAFAEQFLGRVVAQSRSAA